MSDFEKDNLENILVDIIEGSDDKLDDIDAEAVHPEVEEIAEAVEDSAMTEELIREAEPAAEIHDEVIEELLNQLEESVDTVEETIEENVETAEETIEENVETAEDAIDELVKAVEESAKESAASADEALEEAVEAEEAPVEQTAEIAEETVGEAMEAVEAAEANAVTQTEPESDEFDDFEFISVDSVKDTAKLAKSGVVAAGAEKKKTQRRREDASETRKEQKIRYVRRHRIRVIVLILVILAALIAAGTYGKKYLKQKKTDTNKELPVSTQEYEKDEYKEINTLVGNYYSAYAAADTESLLKYAHPMTDKEKSYVQMFASYIQGYENVTCYTKSGLNEGEYIVSAAFDLRYKGIDATAPGLDFFYVRTAETGDLYIDNAYSPFNLTYQENPMDADIIQLITDYQNGEDVTDLKAGVQVQYEKAISESAELSQMLDVTITEAVAAWEAEQDKAAQEAADAASEQIKDEEAAQAAAKAEEEAAAQAAAKAEEAAKETESKKWMYALETVNIRSTPSADGEILASAAKGSEIRQLAVTGDGWSKVYTGDVEGYIKSEYLSETKPESSSSSGSGGTKLYDGKTLYLENTVNVRKSMSESAERVGVAYAGDRVDIIQVYDDGWCKVKWNGETGYVKSDVLK